MTAKQIPSTNVPELAEEIHSACYNARKTHLNFCQIQMNRPAMVAVMEMAKRRRQAEKGLAPLKKR